MKTFLKTAGLLLVLILLLWGILVFSIYFDSISNDREKVDATVVLGASQWNGRPSPALRARLDHAYTIYKQGDSKNIILTGGIAQGDTISESEVGKRYLINKGVSKSTIFIEESGRTTIQSLVKVAEIIEKKNIKSVMFVSHGYHLFRVKRIAADLNIKNTYLSAVEIKNKKKKLRHIIRESFIYILYLINPDYYLVQK